MVGEDGTVAFALIRLHKSFGKSGVGRDEGWGGRRRYCCLSSKQGYISLLGRVGWGEMKGGVGKMVS